MRRHESHNDGHYENVTAGPTVSECDGKDCVTFAGWGLGRGVNVTKPSPWAEKTTFQVRDVKPNHVIVTNDGGLLKAYSEEVRSRTAINSEVRAGVRAANAPLSVRMDVEYTRSNLATKYVRGMKVKTRTISFLTEFADVPQPLVKKVRDAKVGIEQEASLEELKPVKNEQPDYPQYQTPPHVEPVSPTIPPIFMAQHISIPESRSLSPAEVDVQDMHSISALDELLALKGGSTFQERLGSWIKQCLKGQGYDCDSPKEDKKKEMSREIQNLLNRFVQEFGVTHYVSSIELGATEYQELTSREFLQSAKVGSKASVAAATYGGVEVSTTQKVAKDTKTKRSEWRRIGLMENGEVKKEAVIGCSLCPISSLVKMPHLQQALKKSTDAYNTTETSKGGGPYYIMFGDGLGAPKYITVDPTNPTRPLTGTDDVNKAEGFMVEVLDDSKSGNHLEFSLTSSFPMYRRKLDVKKECTQSITSTKSFTKGNSVSVVNDRHPLDFYLETHVNTFGRGSIVRMQMHSKLKNMRLMLKQRTNPRVSCDTKQWRKGREAYYIQCISWPRNGYLFVEETEGTDGNIEYQVGVRPSVSYNQKNLFMLFQLKSI